MAQHHHRPPPVRVHTSNGAAAAAAAAASPPPSPRGHGEKRHHSRKKSGKTEYVVGEKKSKPAPLSRRTTPQYIAKASSHGRYREREREDEERSRDSGESFPQFCMSCEKQFLPANNAFLYCSEACRLHDLNPQTPQTPIATNSYSYPASRTPYTPVAASPPRSPYARHFTIDDGPDIIPRFSPTQSRPRSYFNSEPYAVPFQAPEQSYSSSIPQNTTLPDHTSSAALESLRELATALPKTSSSRNGRKNSNRSSVEASPPKTISRTGSAVWNYIPFASSGSRTETPTPASSYGYATTPTGYTVSQSYGTLASAGRSREDLYSYETSHGYAVGGYSNTGGLGLGMDRPLPPRSGPAGYGHRPKSVDLVTPYI